MLQIKIQIGIYLSIYLFVYYFLALNYLGGCSNLGYELESPWELFKKERAKAPLPVLG